MRQAGKAVYLYNHVDITVKIHENGSGFNIVGFEIQPRSINSKRYEVTKHPSDGTQTCSINPSRHAEDYASITSDSRKDCDLRIYRMMGIDQRQAIQALSSTGRIA